MILLPTDVEGSLAYVEESLSHHLPTLLGLVRRQWVNVKMPRFRIQQVSILYYYYCYHYHHYPTTTTTTPTTTTTTPIGVERVKRALRPGTV